MPSMSELVDRLPEHERDHVRELAEDVLFMRGKLAETRRALENSAVVIPYDNGGGQTGIRANPAFGEYQKLLRTYTATLAELRGIIGAAEKPKADKPKVTTMVGNSKWAKGRAVNE